MPKPTDIKPTIFKFGVIQFKYHINSQKEDQCSGSNSLQPVHFMKISIWIFT